MVKAALGWSMIGNGPAFGRISILQSERKKIVCQRIELAALTLDFPFIVGHMSIWRACKFSWDKCGNDEFISFALLFGVSLSKQCDRWMLSDEFAENNICLNSRMLRVRAAFVIANDRARTHYTRDAMRDVTQMVLRTFRRRQNLLANIRCSIFISISFSLPPPPVAIRVAYSTPFMLRRVHLVFSVCSSHTSSSCRFASSLTFGMAIHTSLVAQQTHRRNALHTRTSHIRQCCASDLGIHTHIYRILRTEEGRKESKHMHQLRRPRALVRSFPSPRPSIPAGWLKCNALQHMRQMATGRRSCTTNSTRKDEEKIITNLKKKKNGARMKWAKSTHPKYVARGNNRSSFFLLIRILSFQWKRLNLFTWQWHYLPSSSSSSFTFFFFSIWRSHIGVVCECDVVMCVCVCRKTAFFDSTEQCIRRVSCIIERIVARKWQRKITQIRYEFFHRVGRLIFFCSLFILRRKLLNVEAKEGKRPSRRNYDM